LNGEQWLFDLGPPCPLLASVRLARGSQAKGLAHGGLAPRRCLTRRGRADDKLHDDSFAFAERIGDVQASGRHSCRVVELERIDQAG